MDLQESLAFVCAEHFLELHPIYNAIMKDITLDKDTSKHTNKIASWLAKDSQWFTLIKHEKQTIVYCHANHMVFYASPNVWLPDGIPNGYAFLCQTTKDNGIHPRLLVLDLVLPRIPEPVERGYHLREFARFFPSTLHLQWSGDVTALRDFLEGTNMPHAIEGVLYFKEPLCYICEKL